MVVLVVVGIATAALVVWLLLAFARPALGALRLPRLVADSPGGAAAIAQPDGPRESTGPTRPGARRTPDEQTAPTADGRRAQEPNAVELQVRERLYGHTDGGAENPMADARHR